MANPYQRARQGILAAGRPPTGAPPLYPDAIMRQPAPKAAPAGRQRSPWEQFSYYAGPHLAAAVEPFATAGGAIYDAFKKNPSEFTSFGGVMPAWRQAGEAWDAGQYPEAVAYGTQSVAEGLLDAITAGQGTAVKTAVAKGLPALLQPSAATAGKAIIGTAAAAPYAQPVVKQIKGLISGTEELRPMTGRKGLLQSLEGMVKAYHGSKNARSEIGIPGKDFQAKHIGISGEGHTAYGWGHYLAEHKDTGKTYMTAGGGAEAGIAIDGKPLRRGDLWEFDVSEDAYWDLQTALQDGKGVDGAITVADERLAGLMNMPGMMQPPRQAAIEQAQKNADFLRGLEGKNVGLDNPGNLYHVEMDVDEVDLLDWDLPLSEQPEKVRAALGNMRVQQSYMGSGGFETPEIAQRVATEKLGLDPGSFEIRPWTAPSGAQLHGIYGSAVPKPRYRVAGDAKTYMTRQMADGAARRSGGTVEAVASGDRTGEALYETLIKNFGSKEAASRALNEAGIPGIRYDDAMSRGEKYRVKLSTSKGPYADTAFSTKEQAAAYAKEKEAEGFITETVDEGTSNYVIFDDKLLKIVGEGEDAAFKGGQVVDKGLLQPYAPEVLQRAADGRPMRRAPMNPAAGDNILAAMDDQITPGYHGTGGHEGAGLDMADLEGTFWASRNPSLASEYAFHHGSPHRGVGDASVLPVNSRSKAAFDADQLPKTVTAGTFLNEIAAQAKAAGRPLSSADQAKGMAALQRVRKGAKTEESGPHYNRHDFWYGAREMFGEDGEAAIREIMDMAGFDAIKMREGGGPTLGVLDPARQVRSRFHEPAPSGLLGGTPASMVPTPTRPLMTEPAAGSTKSAADEFASRVRAMGPEYEAVIDVDRGGSVYVRVLQYPLKKDGTRAKGRSGQPVKFKARFSDHGSYWGNNISVDPVSGNTVDDVENVLRYHLTGEGDAPVVGVSSIDPTDGSQLVGTSAYNRDYARNGVNPLSYDPQKMTPSPMALAAEAKLDTGLLGGTK